MTAIVALAIGVGAVPVASATSDTIAPTMDSLGSDSHGDGLWHNDPTADFEWTASDNAGGSGVAGYSYTFAVGAALPDCVIDTTATSITLTAPSAFGAHTFRIRAIDNAGNCGAERSMVARVDTVKPEIDSRTPFHGQTTNNPNHQVRVTYHDNDGGSDPGSVNTNVAASAVLFFIDGVDRTSAATITSTLLTYSPAVAWSVGSHTLEIRLKDTSVGAEYLTSTWSFTFSPTTMGGAGGSGACQVENSFIEADGQCPRPGTYSNPTVDGFAEFAGNELTPLRLISN